MYKRIDEYMYVNIETVCLEIKECSPTNYGAEVELGISYRRGVKAHLNAV